MSRSAFSLVRGSRLYWYLAIVRILHNIRTAGALYKRRSDGSVTGLKGGSSLLWGEGEQAVPH